MIARSHDQKNRVHSTICFFLIFFLYNITTWHHVFIYILHIHMLLWRLIFFFILLKILFGLHPAKVPMVTHGNEFYFILPSSHIYIIYRLRDINARVSFRDDVTFFLFSFWYNDIWYMRVKIENEIMLNELLRNKGSIQKLRIRWLKEFWFK